MRCYWCDEPKDFCPFHSHGHSFCSRKCLNQWLNSEDSNDATTPDIIQYGWRQPLIGRRKKIRRIIYKDGHAEEQDYEWTQAEVDREK